MKGRDRRTSQTHLTFEVLIILRTSSYCHALTWRMHSPHTAACPRASRTHVAACLSLAVISVALAVCVAIACRRCLCCRCPAGLVLSHGCCIALLVLGCLGLIRRLVLCTQGLPLLAQLLADLAVADCVIGVGGCNDTRVRQGARSREWRRLTAQHTALSTQQTTHLSKGDAWIGCLDALPVGVAEVHEARQRLRVDWVGGGWGCG